MLNKACQSVFCSFSEHLNLLFSEFTSTTYLLFLWTIIITNWDYVNILW